jgi:hypothetical protein
MMAGTAMVRAFQPNEPPPGSYYRPYAAGVGSYYGTYAGYRQLLRRYANRSYVTGRPTLFPRYYGGGWAGEARCLRSEVDSYLEVALARI